MKKRQRVASRPVKIGVTRDLGCVGAGGRLAALMGWGVWVLTACGGGAVQEGAKTPGEAPVQPRDTRIVHEECPLDAANAQREDINGDGRPDRTTVALSTGVCRALDFNFDGAIDAWVYLDAG